MWHFRGKHSRLTASWKLSLPDTPNVTQAFSLNLVRISGMLMTITDSLVDQAYILAFSLIMLHTDAFNKSNKNKMTKASYIKNTRLPGVYPEVLDVSMPLLQTCLSLLT
jgi:hypothetical protein